MFFLNIVFALVCLDVVIGLTAVVCYILVLVKMFRYEESTLAIVCLLTTPFWIGPVIALIYGWTMTRQWDLKVTMVVWSVSMGVWVVVACLVLFWAAALSGSS